MSNIGRSVKNIPRSIERVGARFLINYSSGKIIGSSAEQVIKYLEGVDRADILNAANKNEELLNYSKQVKIEWAKRIAEGANMAVQRGMEDIVWKKMQEINYEDIINVLMEKCNERRALGLKTSYNNLLFIKESPTILKWFTGRIIEIIKFAYVTFAEEVKLHGGKDFMAG